MAEVTYYYDIRGEAVWTNANYMVDNSLTTYGYTASDGTVQQFNATDCLGTDLGTITKVELRVYGYGDGDDRIDLAFIADLSTQYQLTMPSSPGWSAYVNVTDDPNIGGWTWSQVREHTAGEWLLLEYDKVVTEDTIYCAKVEIRVTYKKVSGSSPANLLIAQGML